MTDYSSLESELVTAIKVAADEASLEAIRVAALGKAGSISALLKTLGALTPDERKEQGPLINGLRDRVTEALAARRTTLKDAALEARLAAERVDVTLPVQPSDNARGRIHPISQVIEELTTIFGDMGFAVAEGPDIENDFYNFNNVSMTHYYMTMNHLALLEFLFNMVPQVRFSRYENKIFLDFL
jgi:phenylalanyl-tRNA synthetase alpha chain